MSSHWWVGFAFVPQLVYFDLRGMMERTTSYYMMLIIIYQEYLGNLSEFWRLYNSSLSARNQSRMYAGRQPTHSVLVELKHMELKRGGSQDARQDHVSPQDCEAMTHGHALEILLRQFCKKI